MAGPACVFRVDGSAEVGLGHVTRCLGLAAELRDRGWTAMFLTNAVASTARALIRDDGFAVCDVPPVGSLHEDCGELIGVARASGALGVVLDRYDLGVEYEDAVRRAGFRVLAIDDIGGSHRVDLLLNQNVFASPAMYPGTDATRLLLGPRYALIRQAFRHARRVPRVTRGRGRRVLITLGGGDPANVTARMIVWLRGRGLEVAAVVGGVSRHGAELRAVAGDEVRILERLSAEQMTEALEWADIAVTGGGTTCWELMCLGVPFLVIVLAGNQEGNAETLDKLGAAWSLGSHEELTAGLAQDAVGCLLDDTARRAEMSALAQQMVDGEGPLRVAEIASGVFGEHHPDR